MILSNYSECLKVVYIMWVDHYGTKFIPRIIRHPQHPQHPQHPLYSQDQNLQINYQYKQTLNGHDAIYQHAVRIHAKGHSPCARTDRLTPD